MPKAYSHESHLQNYSDSSIYFSAVHCFSLPWRGFLKVAAKAAG